MKHPVRSLYNQFNTGLYPARRPVNKREFCAETMLVSRSPGRTHHSMSLGRYSIHSLTAWFACYAHRSRAGLMRYAEVVLISFVAVFCAIAPSQAQTVQTLVSNIGQTQDGHINTDTRVSQAFTTGNSAGGYGLTSVELYFTAASDSANHVTASLYGIDSGALGSKAADLTTPAGIVVGNNTFAAPAGTKLDANTSYSVVLSIDGTWSLGFTDSDNEDSEGQSGWSIENNYFQFIGPSMQHPTSLRTATAATRRARHCNRFGL